MRKAIPLVALLLIGCSSNGLIRRKPGSDVVLPSSGNLAAELVRGALCLTVPTPGVTTTVGTTTTPIVPATAPPGTPGADPGRAMEAAAQCSLTKRRDSVPNPSATLRPPAR